MVFIVIIVGHVIAVSTIYVTHSPNNKFHLSHYTCKPMVNYKDVLFTELPSCMNSKSGDLPVLSKHNWEIVQLIKKGDAYWKPPKLKQMYTRHNFSNLLKISRCELEHMKNDPNKTL